MRKRFITLMFLLSIMFFTPIASVAQTTTGTVTVGSGQSATIDAHGVCRIVRNLNDKSVMIPTRSAAEWSVGANAFLAAARQNMDVKPCILCSGKLFVDSTNVSTFTRVGSSFPTLDQHEFVVSGNGDFVATGGGQNNSFGGEFPNPDRNVRFNRITASGLQFINAVPLIGPNPDTAKLAGSDDGVYISSSVMAASGPSSQTRNVSIYERNASGVYVRVFNETFPSNRGAHIAIRDDGQAALFGGAIYNKISGVWTRGPNLPTSHPIVVNEDAFTTEKGFRVFNFSYRWTQTAFHMVHTLIPFRTTNGPTTLNPIYTVYDGVTLQLQQTKAFPETTFNYNITQSGFFEWGAIRAEFSNDFSKINIMHANEQMLYNMSTTVPSLIMHTSRGQNIISPPDANLHEIYGDGYHGWKHARWPSL